MADERRAVALEPGEGATLVNPVGGHVVFKVRGSRTSAATTPGCC